MGKQCRSGHGSEEQETRDRLIGQEVGRLESRSGKRLHRTRGRETEYSEREACGDEGGALSPGHPPGDDRHGHDEQGDLKLQRDGATQLSAADRELRCNTPNQSGIEAQLDRNPQ
jgi:hypothetical protein